MQHHEHHDPPHSDLNLVNMLAVRPVATRMIAMKSGSLGIIGSQPPKPLLPATITPTSTPPIRFHQTNHHNRASHKESVSPSPLTTESQRRYYEDSTWRMFDRIQAARPPKQSQFGSRSHITSMPGYPPRYLDDRMAGAQDWNDYHGNMGSDDDEELIFDLEL